MSRLPPHRGQPEIRRRSFLEEPDALGLLVSGRDLQAAQTEGHDVTENRAGGLTAVVVLLRAVQDHLDHQLGIVGRGEADEGAGVVADIRPPALDPSDERFPGHDPRYAELGSTELPRTECLKDTVARFLPYWHGTIGPAIHAGKHVLVAAHGNSIRALVKYLEDISDRDIVEVNIPTGVPLVYELDKTLRPLNHYYLGDPAAIEAATQAVANQAKAR